MQPGGADSPRDCAAIEGQGQHWDQLCLTAKMLRRPQVQGPLGLPTAWSPEHRPPTTWPSRPFQPPHPSPPLLGEQASCSEAGALPCPPHAPDSGGTEEPLGRSEHPTHPKQGPPTGAPPSHTGSPDPGTLQGTCIANRSEPVPGAMACLGRVGQTRGPYQGPGTARPS